MSIDFLYNTDKLRAIFGKHFCGPARLEHGRETLVAQFKKEKSDGRDVDVYCTSLPADFFTIHILLDLDVYYYGKFLKSFKLYTGSGCSREVLTIAKMFCEGMLVVKE